MHNHIIQYINEIIKPMSIYLETSNYAKGIKMRESRNQWHQCQSCQPKQAAYQIYQNHFNFCCGGVALRRRAVLILAAKETVVSVFLNHRNAKAVAATSR
jgi:hypothetical protein